MLEKFCAFFCKEVNVSLLAEERNVPFSFARLFKKRLTLPISFSKNVPISTYSSSSSSFQFGLSAVST